MDKAKGVVTPMVSFFFHSPNTWEHLLLIHVNIKVLPKRYNMWFLLDLILPMLLIKVFSLCMLQLMFILLPSNTSYATFVLLLTMGYKFDVIWTVFSWVC